MGEVVKFTGITTVPEPPEITLEKAKSWGLERVVIIGADANGDLLFGASFSEVESINFLIDKAKQKVLAIT
jgi:hypothetical protein